MRSTGPLSLLSFLLACGPGSVKLDSGDVPDDDTGSPVDNTGTDSADTGDAQDDSGAVDTDTGGGETGDTGAPVEIAVDLVNPASGWEGDTVTIYGGPFDDSATASFGAAQAAVQAWTDTTLTVTIPPGDEETVDVLVATSDGTGMLAGGFTYIRPCDGVTVDPGTAYIGADATDVTFTLAGCATGIAVLQECTNSARNGFYFTSVPSEVDGEAEAVVHWTGWGTYDAGYCTLGLSTEQGEVWMTVQMR